MKKYITFIGFAIVTILTLSCNKESFDYKPGYAGGSKITNYADITMAGATYMVVPKGAAFQDPGASAVAAGKTIPVTVSGSVNTAVTGIYTVNYTAINSDGFPAASTRYVAVYSTDGEAAANDFSGTYLRPATGYKAVWTKIGPGVYTVVNPGGANSTLEVVIFNPTGNKIVIPQQLASGSPASSAQESTVAGDVPGTLAGYSLVFNYTGYGTSVRTFVKQ